MEAQETAVFTSCGKVNCSMLQQTAHKLEQKFFTSVRLLERLHIGVWELDASGRLIYANNYFCKVFDQPFENLAGLRFLDFFNSESKITAHRHIKRAVRQDASGDYPEGSFLVTVETKAGIKKIVEMSYSPNRNGDFHGVIGTLKDITDDSALLEELRDISAQIRKGQNGSGI
jgi:PAS domain S-box-containing protein